MNAERIYCYSMINIYAEYKLYTIGNMYKSPHKNKTLVYNSYGDVWRTAVKIKTQDHTIAFSGMYLYSKTMYIYV